MESERGGGKERRQARAEEGKYNAAGPRTAAATPMKPKKAALQCEGDSGAAVVAGHGVCWRRRRDAPGTGGGQGCSETTEAADKAARKTYLEGHKGLSMTIAAMVTRWKSGPDGVVCAHAVRERRPPAAAAAPRARRRRALSL